MAFTEDLSLFFDTTNGFAVDVTINTSVGVLVRTIKGIMTSALENLAMFDAQVEASGPELVCRTSDLTSVDHSNKFVIAGVTYRLINRLDDGTGTSTLSLKV